MEADTVNVSLAIHVRDAYVAIACSSDKIFARLASLMAVLSWRPTRYATSAARHTAPR